MLEYHCSECGMGVTGLTCATCKTTLVHKKITLEDGSTMTVMECPTGCGKIKSPVCCGNDMQPKKRKF